MSYTNSPLVDYVRISPNRTVGRNHEIDTVTIHCVVGQCSVETLGSVFAPKSRQASCQYGIGYDGKIGMYCEEKDRSWCTSSRSNDNRAITIEVASDTKPPYTVTNAAYESLIDLLVDICKRNPKIGTLKWRGDKSLIGQTSKQNMTVHRWFANKSCPGDYLYNRHAKIVEEVNKRLGVKEEIKEAVKPEKVKTAVLSKGDIVTIKYGATYYGGKSIPDWVKDKQWIVDSVKGDRVIINKSVDGKNAIMSAINSKWLTVVKENSFKPYVVKVEIPNLRIRKKPDVNSGAHPKFTGVGKFTIVDVKSGPGSTKGWGLLKSYEKDRNGWISLDFAKRI